MIYIYFLILNKLWALRESESIVCWPSHKKGLVVFLESLSVNTRGLNVSPCFKTYADFSYPLI